MPLAAQKDGNEKVRGSLDFGRGGERGGKQLCERNRYMITQLTYDVLESSL